MVDSLENGGLKEHGARSPRFPYHLSHIQERILQKPPTQNCPQKEKAYYPQPISQQKDSLTENFKKTCLAPAKDQQKTTYNPLSLPLLLFQLSQSEVDLPPEPPPQGSRWPTLNPQLGDMHKAKQGANLSSFTWWKQAAMT